MLNNLIIKSQLKLKEQLISILAKSNILLINN